MKISGIDYGIANYEFVSMVRKNGRVLQLIQNPSENVIIEALKNDGAAIKYVDNPTEEMQRIAFETSMRKIKELFPDAVITERIIDDTE